MITYVNSRALIPYLQEDIAEKRFSIFNITYIIYVFKNSSSAQSPIVLLHQFQECLLWGSSLSTQSPTVSHADSLPQPLPWS